MKLLKNAVPVEPEENDEPVSEDEETERTPIKKPVTEQDEFLGRP